MIIKHSNKSYECAVAVKCENDRYIKLYDEAGGEIVSFYGISDFNDYTISGGSFIAPCDCAIPLAQSVYATGGRTISPNNWILGNDGRYSYEIKNNLISSNETTCNITLLFASGTILNYSAKQEEGKIILFTNARPAANITIKSIQITRM